MRTRCNDQNRVQYNDWGGRGITCCAEWNDFKLFETWSMNNGYAKGLSLDRKDNDGNYEPANCRWATRIEQQNNTRNNVTVTLNGATKTVSEWCHEFNLNYRTVCQRIFRGKSAEEAILYGR